MRRVVFEGVVPGAAAALIFMLIWAGFGRLDGTRVLEAVALGIAAAIVSLAIATVVRHFARQARSG